MARIGLLTTSFPRREGDSAGSFVLGFARALASEGHRIEVLCPEPAEGAPPQFAGVEVSWVRYAPRALERTFYGAGVLDNLRRNPLHALGLAPFTLSLARAAYRRQWSALVSHWALPCALIAGELARWRGIPHLAVLHSADVFVLERLPGRSSWAERIARGADALLFSSRDLRRRFLQLLPPLARGNTASRAHVCPMGIDPAPAARGDERARLGLSGFTVMTLSRLIEIKGLRYAIEAMAEVDGELIIAGEGPARASLERLAHARGARVRFLGAVHGPEKSAWLHAADAFLLPSVPLASGRTEGMPHALLEAMDHGLPVVASDTGGIADVVRDGENGILLAPGNASAIATALRTLCDSPTRLAMGTAARETAANYHWSQLAPHLTSLLWPGPEAPPSA